MMSKQTPSKFTPAADLARFYKSSFTLTFTFEILGIDVWHDCNEGLVDLGPYIQGMKIQYQLYPGQNFDIDIMIWPHVVKVWCGLKNCWVRTWLYLQRRWFSFTIKHAFPVRVMDLQFHTATVNAIPGVGSLGAVAKNDKNTEVILPSLQFGEHRYFAPVLGSQDEEILELFIQRIIWEAIVIYIPGSYLDEIFDVPYPVSDVRHQDAVIETVQEIILNSNLMPEPEEEPVEIEEPPKMRRESRVVKEKVEKKKVPEAPKVKFEIKLLGDVLLSGIGRIVQFEKIGDKPPDLGELVVLISTTNLPAEDDVPVLFINVGTLFDVPCQDLKKYKITQLYTKWTLGSETRDSEPKNIKSQTEIDFNDHHAMLLEKKPAAITSLFSDKPFGIELHGIRQPLPAEGPKFFGYLKGDREFGKLVPAPKGNEELDVLIAVTKIDGRNIARGLNDFIRGDYPLFPPAVNVMHLNRDVMSTNDINGVRMPVKPDLIVPPYTVLEAQMTLEVSVGFVGCRAKTLTQSYSRLFALVNDSNTIMFILCRVNDINENNRQTENRDACLTGFAIDTGDVVLLFVEGVSNGDILKIFNLTEDFYPTIKPVFSSSTRYNTRIYSEMTVLPNSFITLKMYVPLNVLLACPSVYAQPALPKPCRFTILKIGRLIASKLKLTPCRSDLPSFTELKSFKLELCVAPRPDTMLQWEIISPLKFGM